MSAQTTIKRVFCSGDYYDETDQTLDIEQFQRLIIFQNHLLLQVTRGQKLTRHRHLIQIHKECHRIQGRYEYVPQVPRSDFDLHRTMLLQADEIGGRGAYS